ncbi:MAG: glycoside hydrolase family 3 protein [Spirochaetales bacterium]|nr:glycoside hydrolase family 3 protein [Spirochaetales bacterium]
MRCTIQFLPIICVLLVVSCDTSVVRYTSAKHIQEYTSLEWARLEAKSFLDQLTLREKASQVLMTGIDGKDSFPGHLYRHFNNLIPGFILLLGYNVTTSPQGVKAYIDSCQHAFSSLGSRLPVVFSLDHEGGTVFRTALVTSNLPSQAFIAQNATITQAEKVYFASGQQLRALGITLNLAPVSEIPIDGDSSFISSRIFSPDVQQSTRYSLAAIQSYARAGVLCAPKHFPVSPKFDPHDSPGVVSISPEDINSHFIIPFQSLISNGVPALLVSHAVVTAIDATLPFCLSSKGVTGYLRNTLGFNGLVITDDISMKALTYNEARTSRDNALLALRAGCDVVMTSDTDIRRIVAAIEQEASKDPSFLDSLDKAVLRILAFKIQTGILPTARKKMGQSMNQVSTISYFDSNFFAYAKLQAQRLLEEIQ